MSIIPSRDVCSMRALSGAVFCDFLNVSFPYSSSLQVRDSLVPYAEMLGASEVQPGVFALPDKGGVLKLGHRVRVAVASASGGFLALLRERGLFNDYLATIGEYAHRVTLMHATADFLHRGRDIVPEVARRAYAGEVSLTRKAVTSARGGVRWVQCLDDTGSLTGTVYMGKRSNADVWCKVYDKRQERIDRGFNDPGPLVRVELAVSSGMGATLRDVSSPDAMFWYLTVPSLVSRDRDVAEWQGGGAGFVTDAPVVHDPLVRIRHVLDTSLDVQRIVDLARKLYGVADAPGQLATMMAARCRQVSIVGAV